MRTLDIVQAQREEQQGRRYNNIHEVIQSASKRYLKIRSDLEVLESEKAAEIAKDNRWVYYRGEPLGELVSTSSEDECYKSAIDMARYKNKDFNNFLNSLLMQSNIRQIYSLIEEKLKSL